jgi:mutator protein MutT
VRHVFADADEREAGVETRQGAPVITVVAAVIESEGAFLVTRRPAGSHLAGLWEFPGGKIRDGEGHAEALSREICEELGAGADVGELLFQTTHDYPDRSVALFFYRCRLLAPPRPLLGQEMRWVERRQLGELEFPPADAELIGRLAR